MLDETNGEIYVFYVDPDNRGAGIGSRLLDYYTKVQKHTYGAERQWVSVAKGNKYGIPFYETKGFDTPAKSYHMERPRWTKIFHSSIPGRYKTDILHIITFFRNSFPVY